MKYLPAEDLRGVLGLQVILGAVLAEQSGSIDDQHLARAGIGLAGPQEEDAAWL